MLIKYEVMGVYFCKVDIFLSYILNGNCVVILMILDFINLYIGSYNFVGIERGI